MKRLGICIALFCASLAASGQTGAIQNHCYLGGIQATTQGSKSVNYLDGIIPACTVTVYLHGTTTKPTIYRDQSGTVLSNPFTANALPGVDPGGWLFYSLQNQGVDVVMSGGQSNPTCTTAPLCYTTPVTLFDVFPSQSFTPVAGVVSINNVQGAFTFTGNVSCVGTSCDFTNGTSLQHNGTPLPVQSTLNFLDSPASLNPPALDPNNQPVTFKNDSHGGLAAETPASGSQFSAYLIPPTTGQYINLCSGTQNGSGSDGSQVFTTSSCGGAVTASGGPIGAPHTSTITWSNYTLPAYVNPANVSAVYAVINMRAESTGLGSWTFFCNATPVGTTSVTATKQFSALLPGVTGANINSTSCTVQASHSGFAVGTYTYVSAMVELFVFYTGTAPPVVNTVNIQSPLNWDPSTSVLSLDVPPDTGTESGTANNYIVTMGSNPLFIPGLTINFLPGNANTTTNPSLIVNAVLSGTIENPRGGALVAGDISSTAVATVILGPDSNWWLQNPQVSSSSPVTSVSNSDGTLTVSPTTGGVVASIALSHANSWAATQSFPAALGFDASSATQVKLPVKAGFAAAANGEAGFDSTNNNWHLWNGADRILAPLASGFTSGHCGQPTQTAGKWEIADTGTACGAGGGGTVTSWSGDGALFNNSGSTGAVTGTLANAGAHKWWGNNTGSTAAPGYQSIGATDLPSGIFSCTEVWTGSGASSVLTTGDDAISNNTCYNDSGSTRTITAVKCRSDNGSNTTTVNPTFGAAGTGTTILSGALTCGSSYAYSSTGTVSNASWTTGAGINPVMGGTLTGTSIAMIVEFHY